ncbi:hypothetical protein LTR05_001538 [Lithohypha guttulata]|uniref:Beta-glucuronidase C-terminal domain-containing protein n=1 Tax=Lithohypha guttulata TaxID=1690604 RepID=A0AAN7T830_9EURO|nr:hypothetical protein LTR05_001538 [Lithohypha guttulata]
MASTSFWALGSSLLSVAAAQSTLQLQLSDSLPESHSAFISPSFAGFGIEPSNLFSFTGYDTPNELTFNLIDNLVSYAGAPPHLRIGGNTQDYMVFSEDQQQYTWIINPNAVGQGAFASDHMLIGPKFFEVANRFPEGTPVTWGLNLAYQEPDYIERLVTMAQQVISGIPRLNLVSLEIGNEPDLFAQNGFRTGPWGGDVYTDQWLDRASALYTQVLQPAGLPSNFFEPGATASTIGTSFQIQELETLGIAVQANGSSNSYIRSWNQHDYYYYIGVSTYPLTLNHFMTLSTTQDQFRDWERQIQQAHNTPYPYALREMGVVGPIGLEGITNTFGAALWTLNFFLYTATLNITSVQMHVTDNSNASAWQPIEMYNRQPFVRPNYYGFAAFDQIIGPSCQAQIAPYDIAAYPENYGGRITAYSVYQNGALDTIVVINANMANSSESNKASVTVQLSLPSSLSGQVLHLAYLSSTGADATSGTTWNNLDFEQSGNGRPTTVNDGLSGQTVTVASDGSVSITVRDSQAVAARIGSQVGTGTANPSACAAIASQSPGIGSTSTTSSRSSASSTNAASSIRQPSMSITGSSASATATNGVRRISAIIFSTMGAALISGALILWT